jgi:hypothetical protein
MTVKEIEAGGLPAPASMILRTADRLIVGLRCQRSLAEVRVYQLVVINIP